MAIEAFEVKPDINNNVSLSLQAHVQDLGWLSPVTDSVAGTTGQAKQLEAFKISLVGDSADNYDVYYRAHVANIGWME